MKPLVNNPGWVRRSDVLDAIPHLPRIRSTRPRHQHICVPAFPGCKNRLDDLRWCDVWFERPRGNPPPPFRLFVVGMSSLLVSPWRPTRSTPTATDRAPGNPRNPNIARTWPILRPGASSDQPGVRRREKSAKPLVRLQPPWAARICLCGPPPIRPGFNPTGNSHFNYDDGGCGLRQNDFIAAISARKAMRQPPHPHRPRFSGHLPVLSVAEEDWPGLLPAPQIGAEPPMRSRPL